MEGAIPATTIVVDCRSLRLPPPEELPVGSGRITTLNHCPNLDGLVKQDFRDARQALELLARQLRARAAVPVGDRHAAGPARAAGWGRGGRGQGQNCTRWRDYLPCAAHVAGDS